MKKIFERIKKFRITKRDVRDFLESIAILAIFAGLGIWYAVGSRASAPERFVLQYFEYLLTGNYHEMYNMVDVTESTFVNEKYFQIMMGEKAIKGGISKYDIVENDSDGDMKSYSVNYVKKDGTEESLDVVLERQPQRNYLLFSTWKVNIDSEIIDKYTVGMPSAVSGRIDGISLDEYYDNTSLDGSMKYYVLYRIMGGDHIFAMSAEDMDTYNETVSIDPDDREKSFEPDSIKMVPSQESEVLKYSIYVVNQMYEHALSAADFADIQNLFADNEKYLAAIGHLYDNMVDWSVGENGAKLDTFNIDKITSKLKKFTYPDEVSVQVSYKYSYTALDERTMITANQSVLSGDGKASAMIYFKKNKAGEWKVIRVVMKLPNYTEQTED